MAVVIRLARAGTKKKPFFKIVVATKTAPRDGKYLARIGDYNPKALREKRIRIDDQLLNEWLQKGAVPSETVSHLIRDNKRVQNTH